MAESGFPRFLLLETSSRVGLVAIAQGEKVLAARRLEETRRHARDLAPAVRDLLAGQGWRPRDVDGVVAGTGPGSYTGLRVGLMSAKTFAFATGCGLIGVESFATLALQAPAEARLLDAFADAQQDRVYVQQFARAEGEKLWTARTALAIRPFGDWLGDESKSPWVTGPGLIGKQQRVPAGINLVDESLWGVQPESLAALGLEKWQTGRRDDLWTLEPLYLRPSAAEQQMERR